MSALSPAQLAALDAAAESWRGTPFCEGSAVKGVGVSCSFLMAEIYFEAGLLPRLAVPSGPSNWRAQDRSLIAEWIEASGLFVRFELPPTRALQPGDLLGFRVGSAIHHLMAQLGRGRVVHALQKHGVCITPSIPYEWSLRLERVWRPKAIA